jgi:hypothetical protein
LSNKRFLFLPLGFVFFLTGLNAQQIAVFADGSAGVNRNYGSLGIKFYGKGQRLISFEAGGGILGQQDELSEAGNSPNLSGLTGFTGSISSSVVIPQDPNLPVGMYPGSIHTSFTGFFARGSYEWCFRERKDPADLPKGLHGGFELGFFFINEYQSIQYRSYSTADLFNATGSVSCMALAPGLCLGYDLPFGKKFLLSPVLALPFYLPIGINAKTNGPFAQASVEARLSISWIFKKQNS